MSFQLLNDFAGLQVPDIYTIVFAAAHNPFASCHRKTTKDTVGIILMSCVCLQALSSVVVPKAYRVIESRCQNELSVGRELHKRPIPARKKSRIKTLCDLRHTSKYITISMIVTHTGGLLSSMRVLRHCPVVVSQIRLRNTSAIMSTMLYDSHLKISCENPTINSSQ